MKLMGGLVDESMGLLSSLFISFLILISTRSAIEQKRHIVYIMIVDIKSNKF